MRSKRHLSILAAALCAIALPVSAAIYQWKDASGKTIISDKPPPTAGVPLERKIDADADTGARQPSLADRDLEFRKRQQEARENAEKTEKDETAAARRNENCLSARRQLQTLESGARVSLRDEKGERYYMDDAQRGQETTKVRQFLEAECTE
ncbi:MAG: DUF4124 domain-containing protein [Candidatus Accumulibacter sp.]|nr:DUF4124 domain-containing protein [Accumulibacter sp.]